MTTVDLFFLGVMAISSLLGLARGLVREALSLSSWVAALLIAGLFNEPMAALLYPMIENESLRRIVAFGLLFVMTVFIGSLLSNMVSKLTSAAGLGGTDRILGCLFGVLRGVIVLVLLVMFTLPFEFSRNWYQDSYLLPYIDTLGDYFMELLNGSTV